jgi:hypothetical protein
MKLTSAQLRRLQTLWGLFCRQSNLDATDREARLTWASDTIGRQISSFKDLSADEAITAIDAMQKHLPAELVTRKRPSSRRAAHAYGVAGRRGRSETEIRMVDSETLRLLDTLVAKLGWTREQFDGFLHGKSSPVRSGSIRTLAEANRAIWAIKGMLRRAKSSTGDGKNEAAASDLKRAG